MKQELFINDQRVDLPENEKITFNFKSNFLNDISKINQSFSQTIKLSKTLRNQKIFDLADLLSYNSSFPRQYHNARFVRNGIEIFKGLAQIIEYRDDNYEIFLKWGELSELQALMNQDLNLNEYLDDGTFVEWSQNSPVVTNAKPSDYGFLQYFYKGDAMPQPDPQKKLANLHPSVVVWHILQKIQEKANLEFVFRPETENWLKNAAVLCNQRKMSDKINSFSSNFNFNTTLKPSSWAANYRFMDFNIINNVIGVEKQKITYTNSSHEEIDVPALFISKEISNFKLNFIFNYVLSNSNTNGITIYKIVNGVASSLEHFSGTSIYMGINQTIIEDTYYTVAVNVGTNQSVSIISLTNNNSNIQFNHTYDSDLQVPYPTKFFPIYRNLPKIKITDFIKNICNLTGTWAMRNPADPLNRITFVPMSEIYDKKNIGLDWSLKLKGDIKGVKYVYLPAQQNTIQYAADEAVNVRGAYNVLSANKTLPQQADLATMVFSASETGLNDVAVINQYEFEKDDDGVESVEYIEVKPRICKIGIVANWGDYCLTFNEMDFETLLSQFYVQYQNLVKKPIVVTADFRLNELDLKNLDYTVPIYLRKYGRFYGIISIQESNGIGKAELLQLTI